MRPIATARIASQLSIADGLDSKAGILFAYTGAVVIAAFQLREEGLTTVWLTAGSGAVSIALLILILSPITFKDPPDLTSMNEYMRVDKDPVPIEQMEHEVLEWQLTGVAYNAEVLKRKSLLLRIALGLSTLATVSLIGEGLVG